MFLKSHFNTLSMRLSVSEKNLFLRLESYSNITFRLVGSTNLVLQKKK